MSQSRAPEAARDFTFRSTPAVAASRKRQRYVVCSVCQADNSVYLFHKVGVRFVRCRTCGMVYVNPTTETGPNYFDIAGVGQFAKARDRAHCADSFAKFLSRVESEFLRVEGRLPRRVVVAGRTLPELATSPVAQRMNVEVVPASDADFDALMSESRVDWVCSRLADPPEILVLHELLEACSDVDAALRRLIEALPTSTWVVVTYSNAQSFPARMLRRYWPPFFKFKSAFFNTGNLTSLMWRHGFALVAQASIPMTQTVEYFASRVAPDLRLPNVVKRSGLADVAPTIRTGTQAALFRRLPNAAKTTEKLSIVLPVFNEAAYIADVLEALIAKNVKIEKEIIVVESNSTDNTRAIVSKFAGRPGVKLIFEDEARGKGHAVKTGLKAVTGTIVLIQDADFEYDIEDYDALLEPILQRKATFVLGSRRLGLDDWKVRKFKGTAVRRFLLNAAQVAFDVTFNALYQQRVTDVNTMFKVFRRECIEGLELESNRFNLDIELACKLVRNGNAPIEVPVNYVARGFDEGKKVSFVRDAIPSYLAFFKYRFK